MTTPTTRKKPPKEINDEDVLRMMREARLIHAAVLRSRAVPWEAIWMECEAELIEATLEGVEAGRQRAAAQESRLANAETAGADIDKY